MNLIVIVLTFLSGALTTIVLEVLGLRALLEPAVTLVQGILGG